MDVGSKAGHRHDPNNAKALTVTSISLKVEVIASIYGEVSDTRSC